MTTHRTATDDAAAKHHCPNGCGLLTLINANDLRLRRCLTCAGVYLAPEALARLRRMPAAAVQKIDDAVHPTNRNVARESRKRNDPRPCPHCQTLMLPYAVKGRVVVTLDHCGVCDGIWADDCELSAASIPLDPETEIHFSNHLSAGARNEMTLALYDTEEHPEPERRLEDALAVVFPTFASWVRSSAPQEG